MKISRLYCRNPNACRYAPCAPRALGESLIEVMLAVVLTAVTALGLIAEGKARSADEIRELMSGNICRCGAYPNIIVAIAEAMGKLQQPSGDGGS